MVLDKFRAPRKSNHGTQKLSIRAFPLFFHISMETFALACQLSRLIIYELGLHVKNGAISPLNGLTTAVSIPFRNDQMEASTSEGR
jgi:hypothetical protein